MGLSVSTGSTGFVSANSGSLASVGEADVSAGKSGRLPPVELCLSE